MDLLKPVSHAEAFRDHTVLDYMMLTLSCPQSNPSAGTGELASMETEIVYHRHRSSLGTGSFLRVKTATKSLGEGMGQVGWEAFGITRSTLPFRLFLRVVEHEVRPTTVGCGTLPSSRMGLWLFA